MHRSFLSKAETSALSRFRFKNLLCDITSYLKPELLTIDT